jgi:hypothetical protein
MIRYPLPSFHSCAPSDKGDLKAALHGLLEIDEDAGQQGEQGGGPIQKSSEEVAIAQKSAGSFQVPQ